MDANQIRAAVQVASNKYLKVRGRHAEHIGLLVNYGLDPEIAKGVKDNCLIDYQDGSIEVTPLKKC